MLKTPLHQQIKEQISAIRKFSPEILSIPDYISNNLKYSLFDWQNEALAHFLYYENEKSELKTFPSHLLFNMATGTGKTLLMAALMLYYYKQ